MPVAVSVAVIVAEPIPAAVAFPWVPEALEMVATEVLLDIQLTDAVFFLSVIALFLFANAIVVELKKAD